MKDKIGLGDLLNEVLAKLQLEIKDLQLVESLNATMLLKTEGLSTIYPKDKVIDLSYSIPKVNSGDILKEINEKEALFEKFWDVYNKKIGTKDAKTKFIKLPMADINSIFDILPNYLKATPDLKFRKMPVTFLNQRVWEDDEYKTRVITVSGTARSFKF